MLFSSNKKETVKVEGMHCMHCKQSVEKAAMGVEGVKSANADLGSASLSFSVDKDADESVVSKVIDAVNAAGFKASK